MTYFVSVSFVFVVMLSLLFGFILILVAKLGANLPGHYFLVFVIFYAFLLVSILRRLEFVDYRVIVPLPKFMMTK